MDKTGKIFSSALIAIMFFACPFTQPTEQPPQVPSVPPAQAPADNMTPGAPAPDKAEQAWAMIKRENVESACLSQAKKTAVASGYDDGVVFGCSCTAQESPDAKSYDCSVSALDGTHPVAISCTKSQQTCEIVSQQGAATYTFDELQSLANP